MKAGQTDPCHVQTAALRTPREAGSASRRHIVSAGVAVAGFHTPSSHGMRPWRRHPRLRRSSNRGTGTPDGRRPPRRCQRPRRPASDLQDARCRVLETHYRVGSVAEVTAQVRTPDNRPRLPQCPPPHHPAWGAAAHGVDCSSAGHQ